MCWPPCRDQRRVREAEAATAHVSFDRVVELSAGTKACRQECEVLQSTATVNQLLADTVAAWLMGAERVRFNRPIDLRQDLPSPRHNPGAVAKEQTQR